MTRTPYTRHKRVALTIAILALVAASCGDDDDGAADTTTAAASTAAAVTTSPATTSSATTASSNTTAAATTAGSASTTQADLELDEPLKLVNLNSLAAEQPGAPPGFVQGVELAVDLVNADGGVGGHPVELTRIPISYSDPTVALSAFNEGLDVDPVAMYGFPASATGVPLAQDVKGGGVPFFYTSNYEAAWATDDSSWAFIMKPDFGAASYALVTWAIEEFGAESIGLVCTTSQFGTTNCDAARRAAEDAGIEVVAEQRNDPAATDLSAEVLEVADADLVYDANSPAQAGLLGNQLVENGSDAKHIVIGTTDTVLQQGLIDDEGAVNLYGQVDCAPVLDDRQEVKDFVEAYQAKYGIPPDIGATEAFDWVHLIIAAVTQTGSIDHEAVRDAVREMTYDGFCSTYESDERQILNHKSAVIHGTGGGKFEIVDTLDLSQ